jgi:hypothetical protein
MNSSGPTRALWGALLLITGTACSGQVDRSYLVGTWVHTQGEVHLATTPFEGDRQYTRRDAITIEEDGKFRRSFSSTFPQEESDLAQKGTWRLHGHTLTLFYRDDEGAPGRLRGRIQIIDAYTMRLDRRVFSKQGRPPVQRPPE